jgi:hypothetical protein
MGGLVALIDNTGKNDEMDKYRKHNPLPKPLGKKGLQSL